jgi:hypothetical protein
MRLICVLAASILVSGALADPAAAQEWQQRRQQQQQQQQQQQPYQQPGRPIPQAGGGGACVPSGFARLTRNCSVNTGACQRLPENCNRGWCCP